jgi:hypothetical protein
MSICIGVRRPVCHPGRATRWLCARTRISEGQLQAGLQQPRVPCAHYFSKPGGIDIALRNPKMWIIERIKSVELEL